MPSRIYKGDLTEVTFGHESGLELPHAYVSGFKFYAENGTRDLVKDTSVIAFAGGSSGTPVNGNLLRYPKGMLVGSKLILTNLQGTNFSTDDDYGVTGRMYTIIKHDVSTAGSTHTTKLTITPALRTNHSTDKDSVAGEVLNILPFSTPTIDIGMGYDENANESVERVLTDQFVGLVSTVTLPETKVDLKRYHVVGLGRDVAVQVPGRFINQGGSFECNIHNGRWLYYCLGHEAAKVSSSTLNTGHATTTYTLKTGGVSAGASFIEYTASESNSPVLDNGSGSNTSVGAGDYVIIKESTALTDVQTYRETSVGDTKDENDAWPNVGADSIFDKAVKTEVRRITSITQSGTAGKIWLDDPLNFGHDAVQIYFARYHTSTTEGSPNLDNTSSNYGDLDNPVEHLFFSRTIVPSFAMEVSIRRHDNDGGDSGTTTEVTDGSAADSKQLTRVFRGCKVKDWSMTADTDAALRLTVNFDAALCYTDTGRLESSNSGDRYDTHRLFEDTANTEQKRKESGIGKRSQKPFMFYNGSISVAGTTLGQVVSFTLNGKTGVEQYYTISGANIAENDTDQIPFAGTRNPSLAVEGKTEYDLEMEIIVDDPLFYHRVRRAVDNFDETISDSTDPDMIRLSFTKAGKGTDRESIDFLIDDYYIVEAPLPIPEDKGPIRSKLKILPKSVKAISKGILLHS